MEGVRGWNIQGIFTRSRWLDLTFFDSDEDDEDDDDNDDDHLILKDELLDHLTQVNPIVFTLNQWYHCKKIHPSKFSNTGLLLGILPFHYP